MRRGTMNLLRKLRGLFGVGVTWGVLWGAIGAVFGFALAALAPGSLYGANPVVELGLGMGAYGLISGIGFGGLLSLGEGSRTLRDLSLKRVALWGILGSAAVPLFFGALGFFDAGTTLIDVLGAIALTGSLGGTFASGSVAMARRAELAEPDERTLLQ